MPTPLSLPSTTSVVSINKLFKSYVRGQEKITVLDSISLDIADGDFVALMGPSGSGKTTLLNMIAGLDKPDAGNISVADRRLEALSEGELAAWRVRNVGFVFQFYNLLPVLTALENVALPLTLLGISAEERKSRAAFALDVVGLADRTNHLPSQLSGGQEQRVAIARAIVTDPKIIVADEPTGDLDRQSATEILNLLRALNQEHGKTILIVTHDQVAADFANRIIRFDKGSLVSDN